MISQSEIEVNTYKPCECGKARETCISVIINVEFDRDLIGREKEKTRAGEMCMGPPVCCDC